MLIIDKKPKRMIYLRGVIKVNKLPNVLKELRETKNMKQREIANIIGVTQRTYSNYETGTREPDIETLIRIADFYGISLDMLTGRYKRNSE